MTATDELRRMLDDRGVEYEVDDAKTVRVTRWRAYGDWVSFIEYDNGDTKFCIDARRLTPEQAIAATLGAGTCTLEKVCDGYLYFRVHECNECGARFAYRAIRSDKNARPSFCPNCGAKVVEPTTNGVDAEVVDG